MECFRKLTIQVLLIPVISILVHSESIDVVGEIRYRYVVKRSDAWKPGNCIRARELIGSSRLTLCSRGMPEVLKVYLDILALVAKEALVVPSEEASSKDRWDEATVAPMSASHRCLRVPVRSTALSKEESASRPV